MGRAKWTTAGIGVALFALAGCGSPVASQSRPSTPPPPGTTSPSPTTPARPPSRPGAPSSVQRVRLHRLSVAIPASWVVGPSTGLSPAGSTLAISGGGGVHLTLQTHDPVAGNFFQLVPQLPKPPGLTANPWNRSPFFTETWAQEHGMLIATVSDLSGSGTLYQVLLRAPADEAVTVEAVLRSMTLPPPATVTQAVHLLLTKPTPGAAPPLATTQAGGAGWLLAGGAPATAQEPWFLFRTTDGGRRWALIAYTTWTAPQTFPDTVGAAGLLFWNAHDGVIVQPADGGAFLIVYRSTDGGRSWRRSTIACPSPPVNTQPPHLARFADGRLTLTARLMDGTRFRVVSTDGGRTWSP